MNILEFLKLNNIEHYQFLDLEKKKPMWNTEFSYQPKPNDSLEDCLLRRNFIQPLINHLAIHLNTYLSVIDVDWTDDYKPSNQAIEWVEELKKNNPYCKSTTKSRGLHIYVKTKFTPTQSRYQLPICEKIELLCNGQWVYEKIDKEIFNPDIIKMVDININENVSNSNIPNPNISMNINKHSGAIDPKIQELIENIDPEYISDYTNWVKTVGSIKNLGEQYYQLTDDLCKKTTLGNYGNVRDCWYKDTMKLDKNNNWFKSITNQGNDIISDFYKNWARDNMVILNKELYIYHNNNWKNQEKDKSLLEGLLYSIFSKFLNKNIYKQFLQDLQLKHSVQKDYAKVIYNYCAVKSEEDIEFDAKDYLYHFKGGDTLDLRNMSFRKTLRQDYSIQKASPLEDRVEEKVDLWRNIINDIFPNKNVRNNFFNILANSFSGKVLEKFIVCNGSGSNGKSLLNENVTLLHGDYSYVGHISVLCKENVGGGNPAIAGLHRKRWCLWSEPSESDKIKFCNIKEITGNKTINARKLFSNNCLTVLGGVKLLECNSRLPLEGVTDHSMSRRLIDVLFQSTFKSGEIHEDSSILPINTKYKCKEFQKENISGLFWLIYDFMKNSNYNNLADFKICKDIVERTNNYIDSSNNILQLIKMYFVEDATSYILVKDISKCVQEDFEYYSNLSKASRRKLIPVHLKKLIEKNPQLMANFKARYTPKGAKQLRNVLVGWKLKEEEEEDEGDIMSDEEE